MPKNDSLFAAGDVIKTHPTDGFWGCAIVLSFADKSPTASQRGHIGITPFVARHDYSWDEIDVDQLRILEFERRIRVAPLEYVSRIETCIGIYVLKRFKDSPQLTVIGSVDPKQIYPHPLSVEEIGNGTSGSFPLYGPAPKYLGSEAVTAWRKVHDRDKWLTEQASSDLEAENDLRTLKGA